MLLFWILLFIGALIVMVKGADWLIESAEKIGLSLGLSPFIVGVTIVGVGTSLPELISSLAAVWQGVAEVAVANVVGSNIANILLIIGVSAVIGRQLTVSKSLIDLDLPLLAIATALLLGVLADRQVTLGESLIMLATYGIYLAYTAVHKETEEPGADKLVLKVAAKKVVIKTQRVKLRARDFIMLVVGLVCLVLGAKYLIDSLVNLSTMLSIATGVIAITAVALGTSLPELLVSAKAALQKKPEVALGNIFGSNIFNALVVVGLPGLFKTLPVDGQTFLIGLPALAVTTLLFVISGISRRVHAWEGAFFLMLYLLFIAKLFSWF